ncbi:unnamed protein product, partial [Meganyctiphanes norvegica]
QTQVVPTTVLSYSTQVYTTVIDNIITSVVTVPTTIVNRVVSTRVSVATETVQITQTEEVVERVTVAGPVNTVYRTSFVPNPVFSTVYRTNEVVNTVTATQTVPAKC